VSTLGFGPHDRNGNAEGALTWAGARSPPVVVSGSPGWWRQAKVCSHGCRRSALWGKGGLIGRERFEALLVSGIGAAEHCHKPV
jgi:hypothetical protein